MEKVKRINRKLVLAIIAVLLISSSLMLLNTSNPVSAQTRSEMLADDMYGWPVGPGYDSGNTFFNPGPAPNRPDVLWSTRRPDTGGSFSAGPPIAFDGLIFCQYSTFFGTGSTLFALDPFTGVMKWQTTLSRGGPRGFTTSTYFKVAPGYIGYESSGGIVVLSTADGSEVGYVAVDSNLYGNHGGGSVTYWGGFYSTYDNLKLTTALANPDGYPDLDTPVHLAIAYDLSDPANPTLAWTWKAPTGIESLGSAPGLAIFGGYGEGEIYALNATDGTLVWKNWKKGNAGYISNYWDGKIYHSASSTAITCYNATTGEIIFDQQEGGREWFVYGDPIAYGRYLGKNLASPYGYVGAWDAYTGEPLWKTRAQYYIAYLHGCVADGKLYVQRYSGAAAGAEAQQDTFSCFDVFTGEVIWDLPGISTTTPMIAYGNLYFINSDGTLYCISDSDKAFPMFHGGDDVYNPGIRVGQSGPTDISEPTWTYDSGAAISGSAVAGNGKVYFGTLGEEVHCVNAYTGEMEWTFQLGYRMASTPALVGDRLYIGPDDGTIYCLNATSGDELWARDAGGKTEVFFISAWQPRSSPIVVDGKLYVGSLDGNLYCVDASDGSPEWTATTGGASRPSGGTPLVVPDAGMVFISASNGYLYAFDIDDGTQLWSTQMPGTTGMFGDRSLVSTPAWDDGSLWIGTGTDILCRVNATSGAILNQITLPYSSGGTMTPAVTTPAIQRVGSTKYLYVGDGFQLVCFDITTVSNDLSPRWERWLGHQVYSSPVVADEIGTLRDKVYFGDDQFSISAINATNGAALSVYTTEGQIFSSACLCEGWLYMGSQDGTMYAFYDRPTKEFTISAEANKGDTMWNNETLTIRGRLQPTTFIDANTSFGTYDTNGYPDATVKLSVTKPDLSDEALEATTDHDGWFEFSYNPTEVGEYGWVVYYDGETKPWIMHLQAYGEWNAITVTSPTASEPEAPPDEGGVPMEYVYVAVAVIVIVLVAVGVYLIMKRRQ